MSTRFRLRTFAPFALVIPIASTALAQETRTPAVEPQLPVQVLPTGAEDAPRVTAFASRAAAAAEKSPEEKLREMVSESAEGLVAVRRPDGTVSMDLQGRFQSVIVAKQTEDGRFVMSCHTGEDAHHHALHAADILAGKAPKLNPTNSPVEIAEHKPALEEK
jgi:hypothetical protein